MGSNDDSHNGGWYMHLDYEESQVLYGRVTAAAGRHKSAEDIFAIIDGETTSGDGTAAKAASANVQPM